MRLGNCADCGYKGCLVYTPEPGVHLWLCGECVWFRENPDAETVTIPKPPRRRRIPLQAETLLQAVE